MLYAAVAVVIIIVVVAIAAVALIGNGGGGNGSGSWQPAAGDYLDYSITMSGTATVTGTEHMLIETVGTTTLTLNMSTTVNGQTSYSEQTINKTSGIGSPFDLSNPPAGYTITNEGTSLQSTPWGTEACTHYHVAYSNGGTPVTADAYGYKGIVVRIDASGSGVSITMLLTGSNITGI